MKSRLKTALLLVLGSFLVYCAQDLTNHMTGGFDMGSSRDGHSSDGTSWIGDGPVGDANAQACCDNPVPQPTVIFDQKFTGTTDGGSSCSSPVWDIGAYRRVVVHTPDNYGAYCYVRPQLKHGDGAGFVDTENVVACASVMTVDPQLGRFLRLSLGGCGVERAITVVGFR